jgi:hypothetical protein
MADLLTPGGTLVAVARGRADDTPLTPDAGPPFPFTPDELIRTIEHAGLTVERPIHDAHDSNQPPVRRLRVVAHKPRR